MREFENLYALVHVRVLGGLVPIGLAPQVTLLLAPFASLLVVEIATYPSVQLVDVHGADAFFEPLVLGPEPLDRPLVFPPLLGVARMERVAHPSQNLVVETQSAEQFRELPL